MMNMHRSGRARALGGAVAFLFTGGAALLVGSAGAARAPQPTDGALVVAAPGNAPVVVDARKVEGLTDTCQHLDGQNRVIICRDSALQEHPDIRAAVDRAVREAASEAAATRPEDMAEVRRAIRHAHEALDDPEVRRQLARAGHVAADADAIAARAVASAERVRAVAVRDALEQARVQLANTDWKETKLAALRSVEESLRASRVGLDEDQREAIEDALREAREQIQGIDFSEDIRAAQEDLTQALEDSGTDE